MRTLRTLPLPVPFLALFLASLLAEGPVGAGTASRARPSYQIHRAASSITIDGRLDDKAWQNALSLKLTYETWPGENVAPPVRTEALLIFDDANVYIGFRAFDPDPGSIRAHLSDRDRAWLDDLVGVSFDTFNDERRAYEFLVNPLGVQMDIFNDGIGDGGGTSWDAIWYSAGRITPQGFVVEMAIPFSSLRFPKTAGSQTWGVDAVRFYPRSRRHRIGLTPLDRDQSCYMCQLPKITGFGQIDPGRNLELVPTVTAGRTDQQVDSESGLVPGGVETDLGLSASWGLTPGITLNAALNPDFSQVEADVAQLDVNRQFALFFPETRPFFLEGADLFSTPLNAVHTRTVADPDWGLKLTGKQGGNAMGVFVTEDEVTPLLLPGSQSSTSAFLETPSTAVVLRYRRDLGKSSSLGLLMSNREGDGYENRIAGVDAFLRLTGSDSLRLQWLGSETHYPSSVVAEHGQPDAGIRDAALHLSYSHFDRNWWWTAGYEDLGDDFRADLGFLPRVSFRSYNGSLGHAWLGGDERWWTRIGLAGDWHLSRDHGGQELERRQAMEVSFSGPLQSHLFARAGQRRRFFGGRTFEEDFRFVALGLQATGNLSFFFNTWMGDAIDFTHTRPGKERRLEPRLNFNLGRHARFHLQHTNQKLEVSDGELFQANLSQLRFFYQLNIRALVRTIVQYTDISRNLELYADQVEARDRGVFAQVLFSYKLNPRTVLFLGYSDDRAGTRDLPLQQTSRAFFFKVGYAWVL